MEKFFFVFPRIWRKELLKKKDFLGGGDAGGAIQGTRIAYKTCCLLRVLDLWSHRARIAYKTCRLRRVLDMQSQGIRIAYKTCCLRRVLKHPGRRRRRPGDGIPRKVLFCFHQDLKKKALEENYW